MKVYFGKTTCMLAGNNSVKTLSLIAHQRGRPFISGGGKHTVTHVIMSFNSTPITDCKFQQTLSVMVQTIF